VSEPNFIWCYPHIEFMVTSIMLLKRSLNVISHHKFDIIYIQISVTCGCLDWCTHAHTH